MKNNSLVIVGVIILLIAGIFIVRGVRNKADDAAPITQDVVVIPESPDSKKPVSTYTPPVALEGTTFKLVAVNDKLAPAGDYTVSFTNGRLSAKLCNGVGGEYAIKDYTIKVPALMGTLMFCEQPAGLMNIEQLFSKMLTAGAQSTITGDVLELKAGSDKMIWQAK